jgi:endonuclease/exonuclease/phosphatase family metal-dependent hydrolase
MELVAQVEQYFHDSNYARDEYLKSTTTHDGWIPIDEVLNFRKMKKLAQQLYPNIINIWEQYFKITQSLQSYESKYYELSPDSAYIRKKISLIPTEPTRLRVATLNVHEWMDSKKGSNVNRLCTLLRPLGIDVLALQETNMFQPENFTKLQKALEMEFMHYSATHNDIHGNTFLSRYPISPLSSHVSRAAHIKRGICAITVDHPFAKENSVRFMCTHLDHKYEENRMKQLVDMEHHVIGSSSSTYDILLGDFNALTLDDYTTEFASKITEVRLRGKWEKPMENVTNYIKRIGFQDLYRTVNVFAKDRGTCRFGTRIDYVYGRGELQNGWELSECTIKSSENTTDHEIVLATFSKVKQLD